jgi:cytochrome c-type biogenesis protein CcmF
LIACAAGLRVPAAVLGMTVAHIGLGLFVLGITFVEIQQHRARYRAQVRSIGGAGRLQFPLRGRREHRGTRTTTVVRGTRQREPRKGGLVTVLRPEKRRYWVQGSVQTTAAIADGLQSRSAGRARR